MKEKMYSNFPHWTDWVGILGFAAILTGSFISTMELFFRSTAISENIYFYLLSISIEYIFLQKNGWLNSQK